MRRNPAKSDARDRLTRLIELATQSAPEKRRALAFELCDLLTDWPRRYPAAMREPFEVLLEKVLRRLDGTTRQLIATRLAVHSESAPNLLNGFYFDMQPAVRAIILRRNAETADGPIPEEETIDEPRLIAAARQMRGKDFAQAFAQSMRLPEPMAQRVLGDRAGDALAVVCKGAGVKRATYSALALLARDDKASDSDLRAEWLAAIDGISEAGARRLLEFWRAARDDTPMQETDARAA
jgi:hypothetical protein